MLSEGMAGILSVCFYFFEKHKLSDCSITVFFIFTKDKNKNTFEAAAVSKVPSHFMPCDHTRTFRGGYYYSPHF